MSESGERTRIDEFREQRQRHNERIFEVDHLGIKRFFRLDSAAYEQGALDPKTKELLGLVASTVLRCNDCIDYHLDQCVDVGWTDDELYDALNVALIVGGSIVIPHLRHAVESIDLIRAGSAAGE
ncbi:MAG TPA: carboxymuconolactone decarboxylase family protein [Thermomicrobiales bacterium]|nr:carboxymuconolactone decarboxylase family protein [Thermomicrobiales bacterium]